MFERLKQKLVLYGAVIASHRAVYSGLSACHLWAAVATDKPEVYCPIAALYTVLAWRG
jgi:hypothetical protein